MRKECNTWRGLVATPVSAVLFGTVFANNLVILGFTSEFDPLYAAMGTLTVAWPASIVFRFYANEMDYRFQLRDTFETAIVVGSLSALIVKGSTELSGTELAIQITFIYLMAKFLLWGFFTAWPFIYHEY